MLNIEEVYKRLETNKKRKKEISKMISDELTHDERYRELKDEMTKLREEKKSIEMRTKSGLAEHAELEELKAEIANDMEVLSDLALNMYVKDESVEIKDEFDRTLVPSFKVTFKQSTEV